MNDTIPVALQRTSLKSINANLSNVLIVGVIIGKTRPRKFLQKDTTIEAFKAVWNFTLRDSKTDYINVNYWGASETIYHINDQFHTGDIVELINPRIVLRNSNDPGEQYRPMVTSPYILTMNEKSALARYNGPPHEYFALLRFPTKPIAGYFPLRDIQTRGASLKDMSIDVLVVIRNIGQNRTVLTKNNESVQVRTVEVFDQTCPSLKIEIWEPDVIRRSDTWKPRSTALFVTNLRIDWSLYNKQFVAKLTTRTIVTENPYGKETEALLNYAATAPIHVAEIVEQMTTTCDVNTIQDVMSVKQVQDRVNGLLQENNLGTRQFTAKLLAFVTSLDLDGFSTILHITCKECKMETKGTVCENAECPTVYENKIFQPEIKFDTVVNVTDHTGTLINCRFSGKAAEAALQCTAYEFSKMSDDQKCRLKWTFLMQRCAVYIAVLFIGRQKPVISVLQIHLANDAEVAERLPVY